MLLRDEHVVDRPLLSGSEGRLAPCFPVRLLYKETLEGTFSADLRKADAGLNLRASDWRRKQEHVG